MQNSGLANALNPLQSLAAKEVFGISMLHMIGWRGKSISADAKENCRIEADLTSLGLDQLKVEKAPSKSLLNFKVQKYYRADFETRFIVGAADLKAEIWFKGKPYGEKYISIKWG